MRVRLLSLALVWAVACAAYLPAADEKKTEKKAEAKPVAAVFGIKGTLLETPIPDDPLFGAVGLESLNSFIARLDKAAADENVKAVVLLLSSPELNYAQVEEIREAFDRVKAGGKKIYAFSDSLDTKSYSLVAGADRISVVPTGDLWVTGIYGEQMYLKSLFDKLGVEPDFMTCGAYKSAAEQYTRSGPSDAAKEMYTWLYDGLFERVVDLIATGRKVPTEKAQEWIKTGLFSAESAVTAGLIDAAEERLALEAHLRKEYGDNLQFDKAYAKPKGMQVDMNNPFALLQVWAQILNGPQQRRSTKDQIAVVYIEGGISLGNPDSSPFSLAGSGGAYSEPLRKALQQAADDPQIKAVVLRVDSPGGSATASDVILRAANQVKAKKPLIVSMGSVAGSGGYYVACGAEKIYADATTITGSIGVLGGKLGTQNLWNRIGINFNGNERGEKAGMLFSGRKFKVEEREQMQAWMDEIYGVFKGHVVAGRGDRLKKPIDDIAGGRVFTGKQALEIGLIDEIGTLKDAIEFAAADAKTKDYELQVLPRPTNPLETLFGDMAAGSTKKDENKHLELPGGDAIGIQSAAPAVESDPLVKQVLPLLQGLDPQRTKLVLQALQHLDQVQQERAVLAMPGVLVE
jgi:protease-4